MAGTEPVPHCPSPPEAWAFGFAFLMTVNSPWFLKKGDQEGHCPPDSSSSHVCLGLDLASQEKERLEEKQREARRERAKEDTEWQTR